MSTPQLVTDFYGRIWNSGELDAIPELLSPEFRFRGSLGAEFQGHESFAGYVTTVRGALSGYRCDFLECIQEADRAFAKMRFSGVHTGDFRGFPATGKPVSWLGAALFRFEHNHIADLWVLGDLAGLDALLQWNAG